MKLLRGLGVSARALLARRMGAVLTLASIALSVGAVVTVSAIGRGANQEILRQTENLGANLLVVRPAQVKNSPARKRIKGLVTTLTEEDLGAIRELSLVQAAIPGLENAVTARAGNRSMSVRALGTTNAYLNVCRFQLASGRFIDDQDDRLALRAAVLGARVDKELFPGEDAVGQSVQIRGVPFQVIGILKAKGIQADGSDQDNQIVIPIRTALRRVFNLTWLNPIFVSVRDPSRMRIAQFRIAQLLRLRHRLDSEGKPDDFAIQDQTKTLLAQRQIAGSLTTLALGLSVVSLIVGGIGIFALMLMSVKERTFEIGLRMAVGASPGDILVQFLAEAILLALGGWLAGMMIGLLGAGAVALLAKWKVALAPSLLPASLATALGAGIGAGTYPARKASLIPPIQALQVE